MSSSLQTSQRLRQLSKQAFGSAYRVEIALAIQTLDPTFVFDDLEARVREVAVASGLEPPSPAAMRSDLSRIREVFAAVARLPAVRGTQLRHEARIDKSPFWAMCAELEKRA